MHKSKLQAKSHMHANHIQKLSILTKDVIKKLATMSIITNLTPILAWCDEEHKIIAD